MNAVILAAALAATPCTETSSVGVHRVARALEICLDARDACETTLAYRDRRIELLEGVVNAPPAPSRPIMPGWVVPTIAGAAVLGMAAGFSVGASL